MRECVWAPCVRGARFVCFASLGSSFPVVCMWGFCFGTGGGLVFVVKLEAPSSPQGWLLHSDCAAPLSLFFPPSASLSLSLLRCCDGLCLLEQHTHLGAAALDPKLKQGAV